MTVFVWHFHPLSFKCFSFYQKYFIKKKKTKAKNQSHKPAVIIKYLSHFFFFFYSSTHYLSHKGDEGNNGISMVTAHNCAFAQSCWLNCRKKKNYSLKSKWLTRRDKNGILNSSCRQTGGFMNRTALEQMPEHMRSTAACAHFFPEKISCESNRQYEKKNKKHLQPGS